MPGLDPGIHVLTAWQQERRGWPGRARPWREESVTRFFGDKPVDNPVRKLWKTGGWPREEAGAQAVHIRRAVL